MTGADYRGCVVAGAKRVQTWCEVRIKCRSERLLAYDLCLDQEKIRLAEVLSQIGMI